MPLDKAAPKRKWWFTFLITFFALLSQGWVLRSAGLSTGLDDFFSAIALVHYLVILGLWFLYWGLGEFLLLRVWPVLANRFAPAKSQ